MNTNAPTTSGNAPVPDPVLRSPGDNTPHGESTWPRVLTVRGLTKTYGAGDTTVDAVRAVDLDLAAGEVRIHLLAFCRHHPHVQFSFRWRWRS